MNFLQKNWKGILVCLVMAVPCWLLGQRFPIAGGPADATAAFTAATGGAEDGYPIAKHLEKLVDSEVVWSQALEGGAVVTTRGGDFDLYIGQDISIGYLSHDAETITLYLQETLTFQMQTSEAVVVLKP